MEPSVLDASSSDAAASDVSPSEVAVVRRGLSANDLRKQAIRECERIFGTSWRFTEEQITPCMVSLGGRPRLYEGRFRASRT